MKRTFTKIGAAVAALSLAASLCACGVQQTKKEDDSRKYENAVVITLDGNKASADGTEVAEYDYTWHCDPGTSHDEVKDAPAEYFSGTKPEETPNIYIDEELYYFPELPEENFKLVNYDGENEWAYYYTDGEHNDYIFATLPQFGNALPSQMMHSEEEAAQNSVLHITKAGTYVLQGSWNGQVKVDLGDKDEAFTDETAKVTLVLDGVDINCTVAPGVMFYSAYECDNTWEDREEYSEDIDTSSAGVNVIIADGSENKVSGTNVFRMLKTKYKDEDSTDEIKTQKKMRKTDGAFYSYVTMNIDGETEKDGKLTVDSGFEGIDSELHLSFNGGNITVNSQDDGINVNEDNVSVVIFNGANVELNPAQGAEGDGVDSNGYVVVNSGKVSVNGVTPPDSAIDSEDGIYYNGGTIIIDGEEQNYEAGSVFRETGETGAAPGGKGGFGDIEKLNENFDIKAFKEKVAALDDDATLEDVLKAAGIDGGFGEMGGERPDMPDGQQPPEMQNGQQPPEMPNGQQPVQNGEQPPALPDNAQ